MHTRYKKCTHLLLPADYVVLSPVFWQFTSTLVYLKIYISFYVVIVEL